MSYNIKSLIEYGDRVQYGQIPKAERDMLKKKKEKDEQDMVSLKSYLDTILPPKESTDGGQIFMHFVSCKPSTTSENDLDTQLKARTAKETGICNVREELYSECFDELIRQVTINCLQRGELLNHIKEQMKETVNYYQKLYESSMAFAMRKVLREQKKRKKLEYKEQVLQNQINDLKQVISEKEREIEDTIKSNEETDKQVIEEHGESMKGLKDEINVKVEKLKEILTTPKQIIVPKK